MKEGGRIARGEKISRSTGRRRRGRGEGRRGGDEKSEKFSTLSRFQSGGRFEAVREKRNENEEEEEEDER